MRSPEGPQRRHPCTLFHDHARLHRPVSPSDCVAEVFYQPSCAPSTPNFTPTHPKNLCLSRKLIPLSSRLYQQDHSRGRGLTTTGQPTVSSLPQNTCVVPSCKINSLQAYFDCPRNCCCGGL